MDKGMLIIGGITIAVLGIFIAIAVSSPESKPQLGEFYPEQGREHIAVGASHAAYNSNPPSSGPHYAEPAPWGVYTEPRPDEEIVHNLEHGGIWLSYQPDKLDDTARSSMASLAKRYPNKLIVTPRAANESAFALASWTYVLKLDSYDEPTIRDFIERNKNKAPEYFPD